MNTQSLNRLVAKETGLKKSEKVADYVRDSGSGNVAYRLVKVYRWKHGDFHCAKVSENTFEIIMDNGCSVCELPKVVELMKNLGCRIECCGKDFVRVSVSKNN